MGFFPALHETVSDFEQRMQNAIDWSENLWDEPLSLPSEKIELKASSRLSKDQLKKDGQRCLERYGICPNWVPAYTDNQGLPLLTGGMAVQIWDEAQVSPKTWFQLKATYRDRPKWLIYERSEIISHEMCHVARLHLNSKRYEETLAYGVSHSWLRKTLGGALLTPRDNMTFFVVLFTWLCADMFQMFDVELGIFHWVLKALLPIAITLGLFRNVNIQKEVKTAEKALQKHVGDMAQTVLFCLNDEQIRAISQEGLKKFEDLWPNGDCFQKDFLLELIALDYDKDD
jgi:hypothetical protein